MDNIDSRTFREGSIVRHFKGGMYLIVGFAENTETGESLVIYSSFDDLDSLSPRKLWARNYDMFMSEVDKEKYPNASQKYRFEKVR